MEIRSIMKRPRTVPPEEFATRVRAILREDERIVVVMEDNLFQGIITRRDVMLVTSSKSNLKARDIMSQPLLTLRPDQEIHEVGRKMMEKDVYSAPVMEDSHFLGIAHMGDVLQEVYHSVSKKVQDVMTTQVVTCDHSEPVSKVWNLMEYHSFSGIPIIEKTSTSHRQYNKMVGMVTRKDVLRAGEVRPGTYGQRFTSPPPVEKVMTRTPQYVYPHDSVEKCVKLFGKYSIGRLPVVQNGFELVGIVDREDILKLFV